jgi:murein DD-endopeptidase MepM/ murein hydrolase activator NlpD
MAALVIVYCFCRDVNFGQSEKAGILPPVPLELPNRIFAHVVKRGDTFGGILDSYNIPRDQVSRLHAGMAPLGFSLLFPGDSMVFTLSEEGIVEKISLLSRLECWYHLHFDSLKIFAQREPVATSTGRCFARGVLETSLAETMDSIGAGAPLASQIADIFAWDINFFVDPRKGDTVEVVYETRYADGKFVGYGNVLAARYVNAGRVFYAFGLRTDDNHINYYDQNGRSVQKEFLKAPLRYNHISSRFTFHRRHPILGIVRPHLGIDYAAPGGTPVYAAADGIVCFAGTEGGFGRLVRIRHGASYETTYGHLSAFGRGIHAGVRVRQGDMIGAVGSTGMSTGSHLDYRMRIGSRFVNPLTVNLPSREAVGENERARFEAAKQECCSILGQRFSARQGSFLVDIRRPAAAAGKDTVTIALPSKGVLRDVVRPGS